MVFFECCMRIRLRIICGVVTKAKEFRRVNLGNCGNREKGDSLPTFLGSEPTNTDLYVDVSSYISLIDSGVNFQDWDGRTLDEAGFFTLLGESGVNWIRVRIWNDSYDNKGNSYGVDYDVLAGSYYPF